MSDTGKGVKSKIVNGVKRIYTDHQHEWVKETEIRNDGTYGYRCRVCGTTSKLRFYEKPNSTATVEDYERAL